MRWLLTTAACNDRVALRFTSCAGTLINNRQEIEKRETVGIDIFSGKTGR